MNELNYIRFVTVTTLGRDAAYFVGEMVVLTLSQVILLLYDLLDSLPGCEGTIR